MDSTETLPAQAPDARRPACGRLLLVEHEEAVRTELRWPLAGCFEVSLARTPEEARQALQSGAFDAAMLDLGLPAGPGGPMENLGLLEELLAADPALKVVVLTEKSEHVQAVRAVQLGAYDYCLKPVNVEELRHILERACRLSRLDRQAPAPAVRSASAPAQLIGEHPTMRRIFETIRQVSPTDVAVLLTGESGTGKELVARAIHAASPRCERPFVAINCGALPALSAAGPLFRREGGSIGGAPPRPGRLEMASGGTVFLDEITAMPPASQVRLVEFLQEPGSERVEGQERRSPAPRVIAASSLQPRAAIQAGKLREDLFYRLSVVAIALPALRERGDDVIHLANAFRLRFEREHGAAPKQFSQDALKAMRSYHWPGNVRELENRVRRAVLMTAARTIGPGDLDLKLAPAAGRPLQAERNRVEREVLVEALTRAGGNISQAARQMGISRPALYDLLRKHRIQRGAFTPRAAQ